MLKFDDTKINGFVELNILLGMMIDIIHVYSQLFNYDGMEIYV